MNECQSIPKDPRFQDLAQKVFGRLRVLQYSGKRKRAHYWKCVCECGAHVLVQGANLKSGNVQSCGCLASEKATSHGMTQSSEYNTWTMMKDRCNNRTTPNWERYGGRGITVCARWMNSFEAFLADMGRKPTSAHSIERKDNSGNYEPGNCLWATDKTQSRNRRNNRVLTMNGISMCIAAWADELGIPAQRIADRKFRGWSDEDALSCKVFVN